MRRRDVLRLSGRCSLGVVGGLAGCLGGSNRTHRTVEMTDDLVYDPETVTIAEGGTVTWENIGAVDHSVTAYGDAIPDAAAYFASGGFESERDARTSIADGLVSSGESYAHTFEEPGTYEYFCIPHESAGMVGTVRVR